MFRTLATYMRLALTNYSGWVIQELALAKKAELRCGNKSLSWKDFSDAVQLFVEVETGTHRISEAMRKSSAWNHSPGWSEEISALGASLLVHATDALFRVSGDQQDREPLHNLEYLISSLSAFDISDAHDTVYALLAIAKDAKPIASSDIVSDSTFETYAQSRGLLGDSKDRSKQYYRVDYSLPLIEVYKEFTEFSIRRSGEHDSTRALDILCRPWAPAKAVRRPSHRDDPDLRNVSPFPSWIPQFSKAAYAIVQPPFSGSRRIRQNADSLVGLPAPNQRHYNAAADNGVDLRKLKFQKRGDSYSLYVSGFVLDTVDRVEATSQAGNIPAEWMKAGGWVDLHQDPPESLWRTLVADRSSKGSNPPSYYGRALKESVTKDMMTSGVFSTMKLVDEGRSSIVADFFRRVQAVIWNRSLLRTTRQHVGLVNKDTQASDLICILYGCSVPVVLRRCLAKSEQKAIGRDVHTGGGDGSKNATSHTRKRFTLVGECYVHGMMNGEAITWKEAHGVEDEVFEII